MYLPLGCLFFCVFTNHIAEIQQLLKKNSAGGAKTATTVALTVFH